ncbi:MAG: type IV pilin-like G/H family protein [Cyanobacteria bacterium P01_G01_bin.54]
MNNKSLMTTLEKMVTGVIVVILLAILLPSFWGGSRQCAYANGSTEGENNVGIVLRVQQAYRSKHGRLADSYQELLESDEPKLILDLTNSSYEISVEKKSENFVIVYSIVKSESKYRKSLNDYVAAGKFDNKGEIEEEVLCRSRKPGLTEINAPSIQRRNSFGLEWGKEALRCGASTLEKVCGWRQWIERLLP